MFFAAMCGVCRRPGPNPCPDCVDGFTVLAEHDLADVAPVVGATIDRLLVLASYGDGVGDLVAQLKYRNVRTAVPWLAEAMAARLAHGDERPDVVTWIPASRRRRRRSGLDQGQVLGRTLARRLDVPARRMLERLDSTNQTGSSRAGRLAGPTLVPVQRSIGRCAGAEVLVVDDVVTTGASVAAAGHVLRAAGARRVVAIALAHRRFVEIGPQASTP